MTDVYSALAAGHEALAAGHTAYLEAMAVSHAAFLHAAGRGVEVLGQLSGAPLADSSVETLAQSPVEPLPPSLVTSGAYPLAPPHRAVGPTAHAMAGLPPVTGPAGRTAASAPVDLPLAPPPLADAYPSEMVTGFDQPSQPATGTLIHPPDTTPHAGVSEVHLDVQVTRHSHPHLVDHSIRGIPVVPVVYAIEWAARAARMAAPGMSLESLRNVKVLKGIRAAGWSEEIPVHLEVVATPSEEGEDSATLMIEIRSDAGVHYRCLAGMAVTPMLLPPLEVSAVDRHPWTGELYGGVLFHGPSFQMIDSIDALTDTSFAATLHGVRDMPWPDEPWLTDPAAFDAGLQMAVLWTEHLLGAASLPTAVGDVVVHRPPTSGTLHGTLMAREHTKSRVRCDIAFLDTGGVLVAELRDVETHVLPSTS